MQLATTNWLAAPPLARSSGAQFHFSQLERVAFNLHDRAWQACDPTRARKTTAMIHFRLPKQSWPCMPGPVRLVRRPRPVIAPDFLLEFAGYFIREKSSKTREIFGTSRKKSGKNTGIFQYPVKNTRGGHGIRLGQKGHGIRVSSPPRPRVTLHPPPEGPLFPLPGATPPTHTRREGEGGGGASTPQTGNAGNRKRVFTRKPEF